MITNSIYQEEGRMAENRLAYPSGHLYALLIGIDHYMPNRLQDGSSYQSLAGCVRDIEKVEHFLKSRLGLKNENLIKLLSTNDERAEKLYTPTYEGMVSAFQKITHMANSGDQVYIHYSGHGGRTKTAYPHFKSNGLDEALVPLDIGDSNARYLRDVEIAYLLQDMVKKQLLVTLVLDSCHSGGATRGIARVVKNARGIGTIDSTPRPTDSLVASERELTEHWSSVKGRVTRNALLGSGWLPEPAGYTLLAACKPSEFAYEWEFGENESNGALTYWLLDSLKNIGPGVTYEHLYNRIMSHVHSHNRDQTPQLQGEASRVVFGIEYIELPGAVNVIQVDSGKNRLLLNAGKSQGIRKNAEFAIFPVNASEHSTKNRQALVEVEEIGATESWARLTKKFTSSDVEPGAQARLISVGHIRLQRKVHVVHDEAKSSIFNNRIKSFKNLENAISEKSNGFLTLVSKNEKADFIVKLNASDCYEIFDGDAQPISHVTSPIDSKDPNATMLVVGRLVHLTKYFNVLHLENFDDASPLSQALDIELLKAAPDYEPGDPPEYEPLRESTVLDVGQYVFLRIKNKSRRELNIVVLDLQPDWGISQIYPSQSLYEPFDADEQRFIPLKTDLPLDLEKGCDTLKVFATIGATNFRWLELPAMGKPAKAGRVTRSAGGMHDALSELMIAMAGQRPITRHASFHSTASAEWVTASLDMHVQRTTI